MDTVAQLASEERAELFTETAARMGVFPIIAEKDFWVCWALKTLFAHPGERPGLLFKGGTSLSKVFHVIERFSEDIDLSLNRHDLGFTGDRDPLNAASYSQANRLGKELEAECKSYIVDRQLPALARDFASVLADDADDWQLVIDEIDAQTINFRYPRGLAPAEYEGYRYVRPTVRLEFGARSDHWPAAMHSVTPYAAEFFPDHFQVPSFQVNTLAVERSFWEKVTLLHSEYHRPHTSPPRQNPSRHYYDVAMLARTGIKQRALEDLGLLAQVAKHKDYLFHTGWSNYAEAVPGTMRLLPHPDLEKPLRNDYADLQEMIFRDPPTFEQVLEEVGHIEEEVNSLKV